MVLYFFFIIFAVPDEDDEYKNLRDEAKKCWDLMKENYEAVSCIK
jgi:hypothetical protein